MGILILFSIALYFLPSLVAVCRNHKEALSIFILNLFLGWTFIGWVISLVWGCSSNVNPTYITSDSTTDATTDTDDTN